MSSLNGAYFLFFSCLAVCAGQQQGDVRDLTANHSVAVLLTPEHPVTLRLDIPSIPGSAAEEVVLDAAVPDISYRMTTSDGTEVGSASVGTFGWTAIPFRVPESASLSHDIRMELKTETGADGFPGVRVRAELRSIPIQSLGENQLAARSFNSAQKLHRSLRAEDLRQAIGQYEKAADEWMDAGNPNSAALALGGKGESEIELSRYIDAMRTLNRALVLSGKNLYLRGWILHLSARVLFDQYLGKLAKGYAEEEMRMGEEVGDSGLISLARTDLTGVSFWLRENTMGEVAEQARSEAIASGVPETLALEQHWKGWIEEDDERIVSGMSELSKSAANFRRVGDSRNALDAVLEVATAVSLNGDSYSALATFLKLDPVVAASGNHMEYGTNLLNIGFQYHQLNNPKLAEFYDRKANTAYTSANVLFGRLLSHSFLCEAETPANEMASALHDCKLTIAFARQFDDASYLGIALYDVGLAERKTGSLTRAFADFREAASYSHIGKDPRWESKEHIELGELLEQQGKHQKALAEFELAESLSQGVADPASLLDAQYTVARWYMQDGQLAKADAELASALEKLEAARQVVSDNTLQASYFAAERKCYELAVELQMRQFDREPAGRADALALEMSERGRARGLLDSLAAKATLGARTGGEDEAGLWRAKMVVDRAFDRRLKLLVDTVAKRDLDTNSAELTQALGNLEVAEDTMHVDANRAVQSAATMTTAEIEQVSLTSDATFFEYALGDERSFLWVIGRGERKSYILPPRAQLESMVKQWRDLATSQERREPNARAKFEHLTDRLSCALLADAIEAGMTKMVIVPDGDLAMLPFAALPDNGCSSAPGEPLVVRHEIALTPSLSVFLSRKPATENETFHGEIAIVADPVFDAADSRAMALKIGTHKAGLPSEPAIDTETQLPRLINTGYEASAIQATVRQAAGDEQVFLAQGFDASVETVISPKIQGYRVWHLATHGVYDESVPEFSGLVFSLLGRDGNPRSGFLKAHDIAQLNIPAELVVLSACDSAAGEKVNGEGVMGIGYAFLHAGAKQVISTLWSVDDAQSKELMVAFYREYIRNGRDAAQALRQSQLAVMRHNPTPYYWAGFELTSAGK
jgi:CHAT domain-containing protein/tetratricopeptide (TPR) repeat protein